MNKNKSILNKNRQKLLKSLPYILLIIANFIYLIVNGFKPIDFQQFLYNFILFLIVAIIIFIKVSLLLHKWFVEEQGQVKNKTKKIIKKIFDLYSFFISIFKKGNQRMMIKMVLYIQLWGIVNYIIPTFLLSIFVATYYQFKGFLSEKFKDQFKQLDQTNQQFIQYLLKKVPRHQNNHKNDKNN